MYWTRKIIYLSGLSILLIWSAGCTLDNISGTGGPTTSQEDLQAAGRILGESLSSDESGVILSLNDALTSVSNSGFMPEAEAPGLQTDRSGRGKETNYRHAYRQQTGTHLVSFDRRIEDALFTKTVTDSLNYQFRDGNGTSIRFPQQEKDRIAFIHYNGRREGEISTLHKQSFFVRRDTFIINGVDASNLSIDGVHHGDGTIEINPQQAPAFQRLYELEVNLLDINISSPSAFNGNQDVWQNVSGTLSWQLAIRNNANGSSETKNLGGTIKLSGGGTALVKFRNDPKRFQVNLDNGDVKDQEKEFEGRIQSVNLTEQSVTLFNGRTLYLTENTDIDQEDYLSLEAVKEALASGRAIWAEGEGSIQDNRFIVSEIEFEREEEDDDDDSTYYIDFEESISAVDIENQTFTLANKIIVLVNDATDIDDDSDYLSLQEVANALNNGTNVTAEGEATQNAPGSTSNLTAVDVEFESDTDDDNDNDDDNDEED